MPKNTLKINLDRSPTFNSTEPKLNENSLSWRWGFCFMSVAEPHVLVHQIQDAKGDETFVFPPLLT